MNSVNRAMKAQKSSKRHLAPWLEHGLCILAVYCLVPVFMLADFEVCWEAFVWIFGRLAIGIACICIVSKWGKGLWLED